MLPGLGNKPLNKRLGLSSLSAAVQALINGALQRSGGTMTGALTLPGNAVNALEAVPLQQVQALIGGRNRIINGTFSVNQDGFSGGALVAGAYGHDMWKAGAGGATYAVSGETATIAAGTLQQVIEGVNVPEGGTYTLSWTGTALARVDGGTYAASPITVTGKTAGANTTIEFGAGTVRLVQYEAGSAATTFDRRLITAELAACQRYFYVSTLSAMAAVDSFGTGTRTKYVSFMHPVSMRAVPTISAITSTSLNSVTTHSVTTQGVTITGSFDVANASFINSFKASARL